MVVVDGEGVPPACHLDSASRVEVKLLEPTLDAIHVTSDGEAPSQPERLILDRGYDSDPLRERLAGRSIERICPHPGNRRKPRTQDGRKEAPAVPAAVESGADVPLAGKLPPPGGAIRAASHDVPGVLPRRLPLDHAQAVMKRLRVSRTEDAWAGANYVVNTGTVTGNF
jgi:hypothetical protein